MNGRKWGASLVSIAPAFLLGAAVAPPPALGAPVPRFGTHDVVLHTGRVYDSRTGTPNPFTEVSLTAEVTAPSGQRYQVEGFFDGDGNGGAAGEIFKVRIFADEAGTWQWRTASDVAALDGKTGSFECAGTLAGRFAAGPVEKNPERPRSFRLREGEPIFLLGKFLDVAAPPSIQFSHTLFSEELSELDREAMLARHLLLSLNKMNVYLANRGDYGGVSTTPWVGTATANDKQRFDLARWHLYESWVRRLRDAGMVAQLWFFADDSGFGGLPEADRALLIRYGMARLSGYANTVFTLALEWQEGWSQGEVERLAGIADSHNPWHRLLSVHGVTGDFHFPSAAWADYMDIQAGNDVGHDVVHDRGLRNRALAAKPLIQEEHGLGEEDADNRLRAWAAFTSGSAGIGTGAFLGPLGTFVRSVPFERLEPAQGLVVSGTAYVLAEVGMTYVAYLPQGGTISLDLTGAAAAPAFSARWFDPRTGLFLPAVAMAGGAVRTFSAPGPLDWALLLARAGGPPQGVSFHTVTPCRAVDSRSGLGTAAEPLRSGQARRITVTGRCGVPAGAKSVAANLTIQGAAEVGHLEIWPGDLPSPGVSALNFTPGKDRANNLFIGLGGDGSFNAQPAGGGPGGVNLILDVIGYFE